MQLALHFFNILAPHFNITRFILILILYLSLESIAWPFIPVVFLPSAYRDTGIGSSIPICRTVVWKTDRWMDIWVLSLLYVGVPVVTYG